MKEAIELSAHIALMVLCMFAAQTIADKFEMTRASSVGMGMGAVWLASIIIHAVKGRSP